MAPTLRQSTPKDLGFVFALAQNGARHGHFDSRITSDKNASRAYFDSAIQRGVDPWGSPAQVSVVELDGERVGVLLVTRAIGTPDEGVELAMIALKKEHRARGIGATVLDMFLDRTLRSVSVYVRCLPASDKLRAMLLRRGFDEVGRLGESVILRHGVVGVPHLGGAPLPGADALA
ncbi:MAG: GNAT family N-acetyltransferase [Burkholderiaceae bacterium]